MAGLKTSIERRVSSNPVESALENIKNDDVQIKSNKPTISDWVLIDIPLDILKPYPGNRLLRLSNLNELAYSIHNTRLLNPIAVAKDKNESGKYIIISGHRRTEAYKINNDLYPDTKYAKIPGYIVTSSVSDDYEFLKQCWFDANFETRQLSIEDGISNIEMYLNKIDEMNNDERKKVIMELKGDDFSEEHYNSGRWKSNIINKSEYIFNQFKHLGIPGWSQSNIKNYMYVIEKGIPEIKEAFLSSNLPLSYALDIIRYEKNVQKKYLDIYLADPLKYESNTKAISNTKATQKKDLFVNEAKAINSAFIRLSKNISIVKSGKATVTDESKQALKTLRQTLKNILNNLDEELKEIEEKY